MPPPVSRRHFLAVGAALAAGDLAGFPGGRRPGSLVPLTTSAILPIPDGAFRRLGEARPRMRDVIRGYRVHAEKGIAVTATRDEIWVWDTATLRPTARFKFPEAMDPSEGRITDAGTLVVFGRPDRGGKYKFAEYDLSNGDLLIYSEPARSDNNDSVAFSADGRRALVAKAGEVTLYELRGAKVVWQVPVSNSALRALSFPRGQDWVTVATGHTVKLLRLSDGSELASLSETGAKEDAQIETVHVAPAGDWLTAVRGDGDDTRLAVWNVKSKTKVLDAPFRGDILHVAADGKSLLAEVDGKLNTIDVATGKVTKTVAIPRSGEVYALAGGRTLITDAGDTLSLIDAATGAGMRPNADPPDLPSSLEFRGPHRLLGRLNTWGGWVEWDLRTGASKSIRPAAAVGLEPLALGIAGQSIHRDGDARVQVRGDGTRAGVTPAAKKDEDSRTPAFWAADSSANVVAYVDGLDLVRHDFAKKERRVLRTVETARHWGPESGTWGEFLAVTLAPVSSSASVVELWEISAGVRVRSFELDGMPRNVAAAPDGEFVAVAGQFLDEAPTKSGAEPNSLIVLSAATGKAIIRAKLGEADVSCFFVPDGRSLGVHHGSMFTVWDVHGGGIRYTVPMETVNAAAFSPDGKTLATVVPGGPVFLWNLHALPAGMRPPDAVAVAKAWESLAGSKCDEAFAAIRMLAAFPAVAVPLLKEKVPPAGGPDIARIKKLLAELDHDQYRRREAATRELTGLGQPVRAIVREELRQPMSQERRARLERLADIEDKTTPADLRAIRAVEIAEVAATPAVDELLKHWATGFAGAVLTVEAKAALARRATP